MGRDVQLTPERWHPRGEAVAFYEGREVLVWEGIVGESAWVRALHHGQHQTYAHFVNSHEPSPHRRRAPCDRYVACGGCPLMHLDLEGQQAARRALVADALAAEGLSDVPLGVWHPSPDGDEAFRHIVKVGIGRSDHGHIRVGAWARRTRDVVPIPECNVATESLRRAMKSLAHHLIDLRLDPYVPESDRGIMRAVVFRQSRTTGEILATLVVGRRTRALQDLADRLARELDQLVGIWLHVNKDPGNAIFHREDDGSIGVRPLVGRGFIEETLGGVRYRIGPGDFFQTNPAMAETLYQRALARLGVAHGDAFVDLYSGVGGLALQAARVTGWAVGVEEIEGAVVRARENARLNDIPAEFVSERVEVALADVGKKLAGRRPVMSVDPARRGLEEGVVEALLELHPRRIAYVSCNPASLARDLAGFRRRGFEVGEVELFDMFPHTSHVETLTVLTAPDADEASDGPRRAPRRRVVRRG